MNRIGRVEWIVALLVISGIFLLALDRAFLGTALTVGPLGFYFGRMLRELWRSGDAS